MELLVDKKTVLRKSDLVALVAHKTGLSLDKAREALNAMLEEIIKGVKRGPVNVPGFGAFRTQHRCARKGRNPRTGEPIDISSSTFPVFIPGCRLKELLNRKILKKHKRP